MTSKKYEFELRPIERNDLSEVTEMIRNSRVEFFPDIFKSEFIYNYKLQVVLVLDIIIFFYNMILI